jgi:hypothetical protein
LDACFEFAWLGDNDAGIRIEIIKQAGVSSTGETIDVKIGGGPNMYLSAAKISYIKVTCGSSIVLIRHEEVMGIRRIGIREEPRLIIRPGMPQ